MLAHWLVLLPSAVGRAIRTAMETLTSPPFIDLVLRWSHVIFGMIWIGHLYFFNLVNVPFQGGLDKELKAKVNPALLLRALWWFRWGAMYTLIFGLALFVYDYIAPGKAMHDPEGKMTGRAMWIQFAMLLAIIMFINVWFVIWPRQKKILGGLLSGTPAPDAARLAATAGKVSRINLYLSGPMLFAMLGAQHLGAMTTPALIATIVVDPAREIRDEDDRGRCATEDVDVAALVGREPFGQRRFGERGRCAACGDHAEQKASDERGAPHHFDGPRVFTCAATARSCSSFSRLRYPGIFPLPRAVS